MREHFVYYNMLCMIVIHLISCIYLGNVTHKFLYVNCLITLYHCLFHFVVHLLNFMTCIQWNKLIFKWYWLKYLQNLPTIHSILISFLQCCFLLDKGRVSSICLVFKYVKQRCRSLSCGCCNMFCIVPVEKWVDWYFYFHRWYYMLPEFVYKIC